MKRVRNRRGQFAKDYFFYKWFLTLTFVGAIVMASFMGLTNLLHSLERVFEVDNTQAQETIEPELTLYEKITDAEQRYGLKAGVLHKVIQCESSYRENVFGDNGKAYGIAQFWKTTFDMFSKKSGMELDYHNTDDQIELTAWAFSEGYASHWSCWRQLYER